MRRGIPHIVMALLAVALAGCVSDMRTAGKAVFTWSAAAKRVVLVEPDVELSTLTAGGIAEPRADWTEAAKGFIERDIATHLAGKGAELVAADHLTDAHEIQLAKLHGAVGGAIVLHHYNEFLRLPNKGTALDWTLGPGTNAMRDHYGADYALFVFVRDSYSSTGRAAVIVGAALLGVGIPGGQQLGFASLVDLRTGNVVWFNVINNDSGDLRTPAPAQKTVTALIRDLPL